MLEVTKKKNGIILYGGYINQLSMSSEAIFDICLTLGSITNIANEWSPRFNFNIYFQVPQCENYPCPYLVTELKQNWKSSTDLRSYRSDTILLSPRQQKNIKQLCVFKSGIPLRRLEQTELFCFVQFQMEGNPIGTIQFNFSNWAGICSYLPVFSPILGISISIKVETQVLGIREYKKFANDSITDMKKAIQAVFYEGNRLTHKIKMVESMKEDIKTVESISIIQPVEEQISIRETSQLSQQYIKLKLFKPSRIFKNKLAQDQHKQDVVNFAEKVRNQYMIKLQVDWQKYLKISQVECLKQIDELRTRFIEDFALEVKNKVIRNKGLLNCSKCPVYIGPLKTKIEGFEILSIEENSESKDKRKQQSFDYGPTENQLIVLVHGYGANSSAMAFVQRTVRYLYPRALILNSKSNEMEVENTNIEVMGRNLAIEIEETMKRMQNCDDLQLSFIGHSLGGLVVRAALVHLEVFKNNMNTYISLATPHLGHILHENKIAKMGINLLNSIRKSNVIDNLLLKDAKDQRLSLLYSLSIHSGLSWFKSVNLFGSEDDGYVSANSALIDSTGCQYSGPTNEVFMEMARNLNQSINNGKANKFKIRFEHENEQGGWTELLLGRQSHISFITQQSFVNFVLLASYNSFKHREGLLMQQSY